VHLTLGILRKSQAVFYALAFFWSDGFAVPAPAQVTQTVGRLRSKTMSKSHPLTIIQFFLAILWVVPSLIILEVEEEKQFTWLLVSIVPFIGFSIVTFYLGWLMVIKKTDIVHLFESFGVKVATRLRGKQAAKNLIAEYSKPSRKMITGVLNILSGLICFIAAIAGLIVILRTL
jgi:hypothetical protein